MRYIIRTLITNAHILLISVLVAALSLGMLNPDAPGAATDNQTKPSVTTLSTSPADSSDSQTQHRPSHPTQNRPDDSYVAPSGPSQNTATPTGADGGQLAYSPSWQPQPPVAPSCEDDGSCPVQTPTAPPAPEPEPAPAAPPLGGCGVCGGSPVNNYSTQGHLMCPMYCVQME